MRQTRRSNKLKKKKASPHTFVTIALRCDLESDAGRKPGFPRLKHIDEKGDNDDRIEKQDDNVVNAINWEKFGTVVSSKRSSSIRRMSQRNLGVASVADAGSGSALASKAEYATHRSLRLVRVMAHLCGESENSESPSLYSSKTYERKYNNDPSTAQYVGTCEVDVEEATMSSVKQEFFRFTKNQGVLLDSLRLVCCDPVENMEADIITSTFLRFLLRKHVDGIKDRKQATLNKVLTDFSNCLAVTGTDQYTRYALFGVSKIVNSEENSSVVAWDRVISDELLRGILDVLETKIRDQVTCSSSAHFYSCGTIWSLANNSYLLRSRLSTMGATAVLLRLGSTDVCNENRFSGEDRIQMVYFLLGALAALSVDPFAQQEFWVDNRCVFFFTWVLELSHEYLEKKGNQSPLVYKLGSFLLQIVCNSCVELRKALEASMFEDNELDEIAALLHMLLLSCRRNNSVVSKRAALMLSILSNTTALFPRLFFTSLQDDLYETVFRCIKPPDLSKRLDSSEKEAHFYQCSLIVLSSLSTANNPLMYHVSKRANSLMLAFGMDFKFIHNPTFLNCIFLEVLVDAIVQRGTNVKDVSPQLLKTLAVGITQKLKSDCQQTVQSAAFNIARLRFVGHQKQLCRELIETGAVDALITAVTSRWTDSKLCLQITSAIITLTCFVQNAGKEDDAKLGDVSERILEIIVMYSKGCHRQYSAPSDWLHDTTVVSNCVFLAWNNTSPVMLKQFDLFKTIISAYFHNAAKPVWGLALGSLFYSLLELLLSGDGQTSQSLSYAFVELLVVQLKKCGGLVQSQVRRKKGLPGSDSNNDSRSSRSAINDEEVDPEHRKTVADYEEYQRLSANIIHPAPYGAGPLLRDTADLIGCFISSKLDEQLEERKHFTSTCFNHDDEEDEEKEGENVAAHIPATNGDHDSESAEQDLLASENRLATRRATTIVELLRGVLEATAKFQWHRALLEVVEKEISVVLIYIVEHVQDAVYSGNTLSLLWILLRRKSSSEEVELSEFSRFVESLVPLFHMEKEKHLAAQMSAKFLMMFHDKLKTRSWNRILFDANIHSLLLQYLREWWNLHHNTASNVDFAIDGLSALFLLSTSKAFQAAIATCHNVNSIELLLQFAHFGEDEGFSCETVVANELAIRTLLKMKSNAATVTPFYMYELRTSSLRTDFRDWIDRFGHQGERPSPSEVHNVIYRRGQVFFDTPLLYLEDGSAVFSSLDAPPTSNVTISLVSQNPSMASIYDLLPAPRSTSATERLSLKAFYLRGQTRMFKTPKIDKFSPQPYHPAHRFVDDVSGEIKNVPLEIVFARGREEHSISSFRSMHFLRMSTESIELEDDDEDFSLEDSVFSARKDANLDTGRFWNSDDVFVDALSWDMSIIQRKPSFMARIASKYPNADIQSCVQYLEKQYSSVLIVLNFYMSTVRLDVCYREGGDMLDDKMTLSSSVYNLFALNRSQFFQFMEDNGLMDMAPHVTPDMLSEIYETITTSHLPATKDQADTNAESSVMKHSKRGAPMLRYHFLEAIFFLADALFLRAPPQYPLKMRYLCRGVLYLVEKCFSNVASHASLSADVFRHHNLYRPAIAKVFKRNARALRAEVFDRLAGKLPQSSPWGGVLHKRMSLLDWSHLLDEIGCLKVPGFNQVDSNVSFLLSSLVVVDLVRDWRKSCSLSMCSFLEAVARLSQFLLLPTEEEMHAVGAKTVGDYYDIHHSTRMWRFREKYALADPTADAKSRGKREKEAKLLPSMDETREMSEDDTGHMNQEVSTSPSYGKILSIEQVETCIELFLCSKTLAARQHIRDVSWRNRIVDGSNIAREFDLQVAMDMHENMKIHRGRITIIDGHCGEHYGFNPLIQTFDHEPVDVANTPFLELPQLLQTEYSIQAYVVCNAIRRELENCKWEQLLEHVNMVQSPVIKLPTIEEPVGKTGNGNPSSTKGASDLVLLEYPELPECNRILVNDPDATIFRRISSRRFHDFCCSLLHADYVFRNPESELAKRNQEYDFLPYEEKIVYARVVHLAVLRYVHHVKTFWVFRAQQK